jgi:hypothetical protein
MLLLELDPLPAARLLLPPPPFDVSIASAAAAAWAFFKGFPSTRPAVPVKALKRAASSESPSSTAFAF